MSSEGDSRVVGLTGEWGSGKTWLLDQIVRNLNMRRRHFNPWLFTDEIGLFNGFASLLLEDIQNKKARKNIAKVLEFIGPGLKGLSFDLSGLAAKAAEDLARLGDPAAIRSRIQKEFPTGLETKLVIIDDIDRLTPSELIVLLKLLRLVGDIPGFIYLLAYDEEALVRLLAQTEVAGGTVQGARRYLEKFVEVRIPMPPIGASAKREVILPALLEAGRRAHRHFDVEKSELEATLVKFIFPHLNSMRSIERFLEAVDALPFEMRGEISFHDWVVVSFLRTQEPGSLLVMLNHSDIMTGVGERLPWQKEKLWEAAKMVEKELFVEAGSDIHRRDMLGLTDSIFPEFANLRKEDSSGSPSHSGQHRDRRQRISSPLYFSLYFAHELPSDAISDMRIEEMMRSLPDELSPDSTHLDLLTEMRDGKALDVLAVMDRRMEFSGIDRLVLFELLSRAWSDSHISDQPGLIDLPVEHYLRNFAFRVLQSASMETLRGIDKRIAHDGRALPLLVRILSMNLTDHGSEFDAWLSECRSSIIDQMVDRVSLKSDPFAFTRDEVNLLRVSDFHKFSDFSFRGVSSGRISLIDVVSHVINISFTADAVEMRVSGDFLASPALVGLAQTADRSTLPATWDDFENLVSALNPSEEPDWEALAAFVLADWDKRSALSAPRR
ncbi:P-loop NTPase fold protein [Arthrobacter woluwensis]|uniref:P-loop NTPase fold protein n=1 Tax=Arthrobacter woluwensis TaxID=156980 RepID=UPI00380088C6